jgi:hypothetical protein
MRGFPNYLFIDMCSARAASSSTLSTSTFDFVFDIYFTDVDRTPTQGASSSTSSTSTFNFVFSIYFTDVDSRGFIVYLVDIDF